MTPYDLEEDDLEPSFDGDQLRKQREAEARKREERNARRRQQRQLAKTQRLQKSSLQQAESVKARRPKGRRGPV